ncbi:hypothetical protein ACFSO7_16000 [Bacillus sp. CGMCC 1.16607]|uniref:hypothetical protein n=1 Tax=Bacillus sp. CGMCC 1.16607 TaxID=3351842 RepID=UPI0036393018
MSDQFNEFLLKRQKELNENKTDTKKSKHKIELNEFYRTIRGWLSDTVNKGLVTIEEWNYPSPYVDLTELKLRFGSDIIMIRPELKNYKKDSMTKVKMKHTKKGNASLFVLSQNVWYFENEMRFGITGHDREILDSNKFKEILQSKLK